MARSKTNCQKKANIGDVAMAAGVSKSTVSNYLNQRYSHFSPETEKKIHEAMEKLRYIPVLGARSIKNREGGKTLGIILRENVGAADRHHLALSSICDSLAEHGYRAIIIPDSTDFERDIAYLRELANGLIAGYFLFNISERDDPYVDALTREGMKFICVGYNNQIENFVASRHDNGWEEAVNHLVERHEAKRIAALPGKPETAVQKDRIKGYRAALDAHGIPFDEALVLHTRASERDAVGRLRQLLLSKTPPDSAILPHHLAENVMEILFNHHLRIPNNLRIVVYDTPARTEGSQFARIQLRLSDIGREAVARIMALLKNGQIASSGVFLDVDFLPGRSCGCAKTSVRVKEK